MLAWLCVWGKVQICIWPSWWHGHSLSLAPLNRDWFYLPGFTFWCRLTHVVPDKIEEGHKMVVCVCMLCRKWCVITNQYRRCAENTACCDCRRMPRRSLVGSWSMATCFIVRHTTGCCNKYKLMCMLCRKWCVNTNQCRCCAENTAMVWF